MHAVVSLFLALSLSQAAPAAARRLSGRVTAEGTNAPIAGARVIAGPMTRPNGPIGLPPLSMTDQDGRFALDTLTPGEYRVDVQKTGFASPQDPTARPRTFAVVAGQSLDHVDFVLQKGAVIAGRVLDASGEPPPDTRVLAMRRMPSAGAGAGRLLPAPMQGPQQTNDLGEFRLTGLAAGEYYVAAMPAGAMRFGGAATTPAPAGAARTTHATTFYPGTVNQASAQGLTVAIGAEVGNIVIIMQSAPAFRVSGVVGDENGNPVGRAMVMLMGDPRSGMWLGPVGSAQTQDDGRFVIADVPAGTYRIRATVVTMSTSGGVSGGTFMNFSSGPGGGVMEQPTEVVVADADVTGVRVVTRRPNRQ